MKLLIIEIAGVSLADLLEDERLTNLSYLLQAGCYSDLDSKVPDVHTVLLALGKRLGAIGKHVFTLGDATRDGCLTGPETSDVSPFLPGGKDLSALEWDYVHVSAQITSGRLDVTALNEGFGQWLGLLDNDSAVLIVTSRGEQTGLILGVPNNSVRGQIQRVQLLDLAETLSDLTGTEPPEQPGGISLMRTLPAQADTETAYSPEDEDTVTARLAGLGYIG